jgi:protein-disulfide isomerase
MRDGPFLLASDDFFSKKMYYKENMKTNIERGNSGQANKATIWFIVGFIVIVTVVVIVAGAYSSGTPSNTASSTFVATTASPITAADWSEGSPNAKVTLIEYGDFECPACGQYFPVVEQLIQSNSTTVRFVFRNFPLYTIHPFAGIGAQVAEAAGLEGGQSAYWAMNNLLYTKQSDWSTDTTVAPAQLVSNYFNGYAQSIGLDVGKFDADINATSVTDKIQNDVNSGNAAQIDHTPTFFINLTQIPNPTSTASFQAALSAAIAAASPTLSSTTAQ